MHGTRTARAGAPDPRGIAYSGAFPPDHKTSMDADPARSPQDEEGEQEDEPGPRFHSTSTKSERGSRLQLCVGFSSGLTARFQVPLTARARDHVLHPRVCAVAPERGSRSCGLGMG